MNQLISILMPVKNTADFLEECIDSIIHQSYTNWELLAVDDHSSDNSLAILKSYRDKDERIKVFSNKGSGIVAALRLAYQYASGDYITRMDSDDTNSLTKYEMMVKQLQSFDMGHVALGQVKYFSDIGIGDGYAKYENWLNDLIISGTNFSQIYKECPIPSPCWMMYKDDIERIGGIVTELIPEDYDLAFRMYKGGISCIPCDQVLLNWRDSPSRTSRTHIDYTEKKMLALKCHYFLNIDFDRKNELVLWGAGRRGKFIAKYLLDKRVPFTWVCNNENKIGHDIYGMTLNSIETLDAIANKQIIVSVANQEEQLRIREKCVEALGETYFFC